MNPYSPKFSSFIHINGHNWVKYENDCSIDFNLEQHFDKEDQSASKCEQRMLPISKLFLLAIWHISVNI
ncbi:MAG: hypothetical protein R2772_09210 [Chitinophagales bacterium]